MSEDPLPAGFFERADESPDPLFYTQPRLVTHIDDVTIEALRDYYREALPRDGEILDLMSSWVSHLPDDVAYSRIAGLGMNALELDQNPRLHERVVHDLNTSPELPFADASFDAVINAVSVQYLKRPLEVFAEVARVLRGLFPATLRVDVEDYDNRIYVGGPRAIDARARRTAISRQPILAPTLPLLAIRRVPR